MLTENADILIYMTVWADLFLGILIKLTRSNNDSDFEAKLSQICYWANANLNNAEGVG